MRDRRALRAELDALAAEIRARARERATAAERAAAAAAPSAPDIAPGRVRGDGVRGATVPPSGEAFTPVPPGDAAAAADAAAPPGDAGAAADAAAPPGDARAAADAAASPGDARAAADAAELLRVLEDLRVHLEDGVAGTRAFTAHNPVVALAAAFLLGLAAGRLWRSA